MHNFNHKQNHEKQNLEVTPDPVVNDDVILEEDQTLEEKNDTESDGDKEDESIPLVEAEIVNSSEETIPYIYKTESSLCLNIRKEPVANAPVVLTIKPNTEVLVNEGYSDNTFFNVIIGDVNAYAVKTFFVKKD